MIKKIQAAFQKRKIEKTRKEYLQLVEQNAKDTRSRLKLGDLYMKAGEMDLAVEQYAQSAEIFSEAGFHLKSIALYKQILKMQPQSVRALRRAAQISYQYGLYADAYPYYETLARILRSSEEEGGERLWEVFQDIARLPMKETRQKILVFETLFPAEGELFSEPYDKLVELGRRMGREGDTRADAVNLMLWTVRTYPQGFEALEVLVELLHGAERNAEAQKALRQLEGVYESLGILESKTDFLEKYRTEDDWMQEDANSVADMPQEPSGKSGEQVKVKMEANIYDLLKKKASTQKQDESSAGDMTGDAAHGGSPLEKLEFDDLFENFKEGIEGQIAKDDSETHYNLGVAYQEMELYEDAIREFEVASENPALQHDAYFMMGNCAREIDRVDEALAYYDKALSIGGLGLEQVCAIRYEQALTLRAAGRNDEALNVFREIQQKSSNYRDIEKHIQELV